MIIAVDEDANIEFGEFLKIIKSSKGGGGGGTQSNMADINDFFKQMTAGGMGNEDMSFNMLVQSRRRQHMLDAILFTKEDSKDSKKVENNKKGKAILNAVKESLKAQMQRIKDAE